MLFHVHVIDDTPTFCVMLKRAFQSVTGPEWSECSFSVATFTSPDSYAQGAVEEAINAPSLVLVDIEMNGDSHAGLRVAHMARERFPQCVIVMLSNRDDADTVLEYLNAGADSFISKSNKPADLVREALLCVQVAQRKRGQDFTNDPPPFPLGAALQKVWTRIPYLLSSAVRTLHVVGETGTGKEVVANLLAARLPDRMPFVRVNCGALAPSVLEAELFGYRKGAFTGADRDRTGLLEAANGGWLFLDEVALLSIPAQQALLRALENEEVIRIGETQARRITLRVLSATNEDLKAKVALGQFRKDLWQRLTDAVIELPPLRERREEIDGLIDAFAHSMPQGPYEVTTTAKALLKRHTWQEGNVRELRNCLRAMTEFSPSKVLGPNSIPTNILFRMTNRQHAVFLESSSREYNLPKLERELYARVLNSLLDENHTLRSLSERTCLPRTTLARRLRELVDAGAIPSSRLPKGFRKGSDLGKPSMKATKQEISRNGKKHVTKNK